VKLEDLASGVRVVGILPGDSVLLKIPISARNVETIWL